MRCGSHRADYEFQITPMTRYKWRNLLAGVSPSFHSSIA